jgi:predicted transcriptional regulator
MAIALKVKDVMDRNVRSVDGDVTVKNAIGTMLQWKVWSLIVEKEGKPAGVVTDRDIIRRCFAKGLPQEKTSVWSIASSPLITVGPDVTIRDAMDITTMKDVRRLFVVDKGKIIGRVTQTDLFQSTLSLLETLSELPDSFEWGRHIITWDISQGRKSSFPLLTRLLR